MFSRFIRFCSLIIVLLFLNSISCLSQTFYINTGYPGVRDNNTYVLNVSPCDSFRGLDSIPALMYTCPPTQNLNPNYKTMYDDIAVDKYDNIWYVSQIGDLYKRKLNDTNSCQYIGNFTSDHRIVNSLVADSAGDIYAVTQWYDSCEVIKYDATGFHTLGYLPKNITPSGDLFFYEYRLFLLCYYQKANNSFITEIALKDPSQSCYYMSLDSMYTYSAFSVLDHGRSRAFVLKSNVPNYLSSSLVEIDIPNRKVLGTTCEYPFFVRGAASSYNLTGDSTKCVYFPQGVTQLNKNQQVTVLNPCTDVIRIKDAAAIDYSEISKATLYDLSGRMIKAYEPSHFPKQLNISDIAEGLYMLRVSYKNGQEAMQKVQKM